MDWSQYGEESKLRLPLWMRVGLKVDEFLRSKTRRDDGSINRRLSRLLDWKAPACPHPFPASSRAVSSTDVVIHPDTGLWVRIYSPPHDPSTTGERSMPIVFYFHGGGFAELCANLTFYDSFCKRLSKACKVVVISVNYRKAPEHRYPTAYDDCLAALKWAASEPSTQHIPSVANPASCFLMGDSAGGNIVHHVACMASSSSSPHQNSLSPILIKGSFLLFPFFGGEARTASELRMPRVPLGTLKEADWYWKAYLPVGANRDHPASNVVGPHSLDYTKLSLPPCLVVVAEHDFLKDMQLRYVEKLKASGKLVHLEYYKGGIHSFHVFKQLKMSSDLMIKLDKFIKDMEKRDEDFRSPPHNML